MDPNGVSVQVSPKVSKVESFFRFSKQMAPKKADSSVVGFDVTISSKELGDLQYDQYKVVGRALREVATKFVFQLEESKDGYVHYQCRYRVSERIRVNAHIAQCRETLLNGHISITSAEVHQGNNFNYVMKSTGRLDGPWDDRNDCFTPDPPPPSTRQLREFLKCELRPWQLQVLSWCTEWDMRTIKIVVDPVGNFGKSIFAEYLEFKQLAVDLMYTDNIKEVMQQVHGQKKRSAYIVDLPRAINQRAMAQFIAGLELLKNGVCYDPRYEWKKVRFDRPMVIVFCNIHPSLKHLSPDRYESWMPTLDRLRLEPWVDFAHQVPSVPSVPQSL